MHEVNKNPAAERFLTIRIPIDLVDEFRALARLDERTVSQQIRLLINEYVAEHRAEAAA